MSSENCITYLYSSYRAPSVLKKSWAGCLRGEGGKKKSNLMYPGAQLQTYSSHYLIIQPIINGKYE